MLSLILDFLFLGEVPTTTNTSDPVLLDWLEETVNKEKELYADYIALDLLKLLGQCKADSSHVQEVLALLKFMVEKFTPPSAEVGFNPTFNSKDYLKTLFYLREEISINGSCCHFLLKVTLKIYINFVKKKKLLNTH